MYHTTFVQIAYYDWLTGRIKGKFFKKYSTFLFLETIRRMKLKLGMLA